MKSLQSHFRWGMPTYIFTFSLEIKIIKASRLPFHFRYSTGFDELLTLPITFMTMQLYCHKIATITKMMAKDPTLLRRVSNPSTDPKPFCWKLLWCGESFNRLFFLKGSSRGKRWVFASEWVWNYLRNSRRALVLCGIPVSGQAKKWNWVTVRVSPVFKFFR